MSPSEAPRARGRLAGGESRAAHTVREALGAIASPGVVRQIVEGALAHAGEPQVPAGGSDLRRFVAHALDHATRAVLGDAAAETLLTQLAPVIARIPSEMPPEEELTSGTRLRPAKRLSPQLAQLAQRARRQRKGGHGRAVIVATHDLRLVDQLAQRLEDNELIVAGDVVTMLDAAQESRSRAPMLIVDAGAPSVQPSTLVTVAPDLLPGTEIVLWRAGPEVLDRLALFANATEGWRRYGLGATLDELTAVLSDA